jgi:hypothetical protein
MAPTMKLLSHGIWHHVVWRLETNISKKQAASILKVNFYHDSVWIKLNFALSVQYF